MKIEQQINEKTSNILLQVGIPYNISGSKYLRRAVEIAINNRGVSILVTKNIYPVIAAENNTKAANVERAIRHAIDIAWNKNKIIYLNKLFGLEIYDEQYKPSNSEFIALLAERIPFMTDESW